MDELSRYFEILEVPRGASLEQVKQAYRDLAQVWHPDKYGHNPRLRLRAEEKLKNINEAYQRLSTALEGSFTYAPSAAQNSPASPHPPATSQHHRPGPTAQSPRPPPPYSTPASEWAPDPPAEPPRRRRMLAFLTMAIVIFGFVVLAMPRRWNGKRATTPTPGGHPAAASSPPATAEDYEQLARIKVQIRARVDRKDAEFNRLQQWYQQGVTAQDETSYRAALDKARQDEQEIAALILAYNAAKKSLDGRNPAR